LPQESGNPTKAIIRQAVACADLLLPRFFLPKSAIKKAGSRKPEDKTGYDRVQNGYG